ncbi:MAG: hypothetical protein HY718_21775, partial [Planctomycetes bacterium]|nr:hypothetical protein [Planctomycetota bacterium]
VLTRFQTDQYGVEVLSWIDPVDRDVAGLRIDARGDCPPIVVGVPRDLKVHYQQEMQQSFSGQVNGDTWRATVRCLSVQTPLTVKTTASLEPAEQGVKLRLKPGRNWVLVAVNSDVPKSGERSLQQTIESWHACWNGSGWLDLPDETAQKVWVRSLAYIFCSHNDDGIGDSPPTGLSGGGWPFPFPFDSGCRHPLLLWTGRTDAARRWIEFWSSRREGLEKYTRRIWNRDGTMLPHVFPYGPAEDYHVPEPPNYCYYPIYNAGHLVRMAHQTAVMVNDPQWTKRYAAPLIDGAARFYLDIAKKGDDGLWHFTVVPSLGLDEDGGRDQPDYICTLFSAEYAFRRAVDYGLDRDGRMATILREGLAYKALLSDRGLYYANLGTGVQDLAHQKHPDQLSALVNIPVGPAADDPTRRSHQLRYQITAGADKPAFAGHTLGELILASARMQDAGAWRRDWTNVQRSAYADPDWMQFYESSGSRLAYYVTTHGLFAQAILETIVSTWWERLDLAPCVPWPGRVGFGNLRTLLGVTVSGDLTDGRGQAALEAWKDTTFRCQDRTITLKKGERVTVDIGKDR